MFKMVYTHPFCCWESSEVPNFLILKVSRTLNPNFAIVPTLRWSRWACQGEKTLLVDAGIHKKNTQTHWTGQRAGLAQTREWESSGPYLPIASEALKDTEEDSFTLLQSNTIHFHYTGLEQREYS